MTTDKENELICEKLLGWKKGNFPTLGAGHWIDRAGYSNEISPMCFTDWASAGLIVENRQLEGWSCEIYVGGRSHCVFYKKGAPRGERFAGDSVEGAPVAVRAAAISWLRAQGHL